MFALCMYCHVIDFQRVRIDEINQLNTSPSPNRKSIFVRTIIARPTKCVRTRYIYYFCHLGMGEMKRTKAATVVQQINESVHVFKNVLDLGRPYKMLIYLSKEKKRNNNNNNCFSGNDFSPMYLFGFQSTPKVFSSPFSHFPFLLRPVTNKCIIV